MLGIVKSHIIVSWLFFLWSVTVPHDAIVYGQIITTPTSDNASSIPVSSPTPSPTTPIIQVTTEAATTTKPDPKPVPPLNIVFGQVGRNASVPCFIDALAVYPDKMLSTTWKKNRMFIVNAAMGEDGKLSLSYLDDELKKKYKVEEDYSLVVTELEMKDTTNFTCTVIKFQTDQRLVHDVIYTNITYLLVQDVPSPPGRPSILEKSSRTAKISWSPSQTDNNSPIMHYSVNVMDRTMINQGRSHFSSRHRWNNMGVKVKQVSVFTNENPSAVLTGLHPYTAYQITVSAVNKIGTSIESQLSDIFYTDSEAPEAPPLHLVATSNFSSRIHLSWDPPPLNKHHGNLEGYRIQYTSERDGINSVITLEDPKKTKITLFGLQPFEAYEVSVLAFNNIGEGPAVKKLIRTAEGIPGKPLMIHTNTQPMSTSFVVKWLAPGQVNGHIMSYELRWQHNNITKTKVISKYLNNPMLEQVTNLKPFTQYRVQVRAITGGGKGEFSDVYPVYTDVAGPSSPEVTNLTVLGSRSIYISWEPPKQFYRTIDHYYIQIIDTSTNHQQRRALENNERETIVTGLPTNTEFTLKIAGVTKSLHSNMHYIGEFSKPWTFSLSDVPSPPGRPSILEKSSRTAKISWSPSQTDNNSPIMHYSVNVMDRTMINQGRSHFSSRHRWNNMGVKVKQVSVFTNENPSAVLTGLHPYTAYQITVSAVNKIGTSIESQLSDIFYTDSEAPEAPPLHLVATSNFSSRIHLSWDPPPLNKHHGNLEGYRIQYTSERDGINRVITLEDPKKTKITLFGLQPFEAYEVSVLAFNNIGEGPAVKKLIRTAEGIPGKPLMIHTNTQPMSTSFVVKWLAPGQVNGHIMSYELRWQHNNITKTKVISKYLNNPMLEQVTNLKPFTQYRVQVRAITGGGKGEFSDVYPVYTDVAGPSSPEVTNLTVLGSRSIYISWEPPKQFYRTIDHYYIQIIDTSTNHQQRRALENNERETIVTGLPTNTEFTLKIAGVTKSLHSNMHYIGEFSKPWTFSLSEKTKSNDTLNMISFT
ncbi:protein sidekick-1-like isoform X2 [Ostrea edulis]|uniref:protein sidekick-1-like isoform X2 n=1 Tax=Ostrea edulis TaxID=37623 RepID=UPI0024AF0C01|nr:protein sidekick-1-like isoform X2 [Ostrea edulis]